MNQKRILALLSAAALCFTTLTGCNSSKNQTPSNIQENAESGEQIASDAVVLSVDGTDITMGEFGYYIYNAATLRAYQIDQKPDLLNFDWDQKTASGQPLCEAVIEEALDTVTAEQLMIEKAAEKGVVYSEEEKSEHSQSVEEFIAENGEEAFLLNANALGIPSVEDYKKLSTHVFAAQKAEDAIVNGFSEYAEDEEALKEYSRASKMTAKHILIKNDSERFSDPKATIEEVRQRALAGEDFDALMKEYNEDPGEDESGYTFGRGEMVQEFEDAAFALQCGEISDVVETTYGYHIIKRVAGLAELQSYWMKNANTVRFDDVIEKISVAEIVKTAVLAQNTMQAQNSQQSDQTTGGK